MIRCVHYSYDEDGKSISYKLRDKYFRQQFLLKDNVFLKLTEAFYLESSNRQSEHYSEEVRRRYFEQKYLPSCIYYLEPFINHVRTVFAILTSLPPYVRAYFRFFESPSTPFYIRF